jgi:hypothetical protein
MPPRILLFAVLVGFSGTASALEYVTINRAGAPKLLSGKVVVEAEDGGLLFLTADGVQWLLPKEEIVSRRSDEKPFVPLPRDALARQLTAELPGFRIHKTRHYVIAYNTTEAYAAWVGALFERLHTGFYAFWKSAGAELHEPEFPLVALVFKDQESYARHVERELGPLAKSIVGYYSLTTNRMTTYDLTGIADAGGGGPPAALIAKVLDKPEAERTVATIVHEATHQIAFNSGLQVRFTDMPFWVSEGLAIYFETPDLKNNKGWKAIGTVNRVNLINFRKALRTRPGLVSLLSDDKRFREAATSPAAYAEAWALSYFLIRTRREDYVKYLAALAQQTPQVFLEPAERIKQFQQFFGDDLPALETEFLRYMQQVE